MRERIFLSYSHKDCDWRDRFETAFGGGIYARKLDLWSDQDIPTGAGWQKEIADAIAGSRVALLLVSRNFLRSDFIINDELASIVRRNALAGSNDPEALKVWWVPLENITPTELELAGLNNIQAVLSPDTPLSTLDEHDRDDAIANIAVRLINELKLLTDFDSTDRDEFKTQVRSSLGANTVLKEALAPGDYSIIYRAEALGVEVAVKALVPSRRMPWLADDFIRRARIVKNIRHEAAIEIKGVIDGPIKCILMDYAAAPTIQSLMNRKAGCVSCSDAATILAQLAELAAALHELDSTSILGPIQLSHIHFDEKTKKVQISLVHIANETLQSCRQRPTVLFDNTALTYLSPERYDGRPVNAMADQYYLALLGLELLCGKPPVEATAFADLEEKRRFFDGPREFFGELQKRSPDMAFVLAKMLERAPGERWPSMSDAAKALRQIADGAVPEVILAHASDIYKKKIRGNAAFFAAFYESLRRSSEDLARLFDPQRVTMEAQYQKLDKAMGYVFNFKPQIEPTTLDSQVESHSGYALKAEHFTFFLDSFLDALSTIGIADSYSMEAWRAVLNPALTYMRERVAVDAADRKPARSDDAGRVQPGQRRTGKKPPGPNLPLPGSKRVGPARNRRSG